MNPLLAEPTSEQVALLNVIYRGHEQAGWPNYQRTEQTTGGVQRVGKPTDWPIFQYVETVLYQEHGLDAAAVIRGCPSVPFNAGQGRYGWIDFDKHNAMMLGAEDKVRLNVAGMARQPRAAVEVEMFIDVLATLVDVDRALTPSPSEVQNVQIGAGELRRRLEPPHGRWRLGVAELDSIAAVLDRELSTWNWQLQRGEAAGEWTATLRPFIRAYSAIRTPEEYVERVVQRLVPHAAPPEPLHPPSLSLPEAIDYLMPYGVLMPAGRCYVSHAPTPRPSLSWTAQRPTRWRHASAHSVASSATRSSPTARATNPSPILKRYMMEHLPAEALARAELAVDVLRAFFDIRAWRQHSGGRAETQGRRGMERLEVELPTSDWQGAWRHLQTRAVVALSALREEVDALS